ncbi:MAG: hypothetical protein ACTS73_09290 [Arsenophonus sp. NEOnobi-MAG3]
MRGLSDTRYVCFCGDGIYSPVRQGDRLCLLLLLLASLMHGCKKLVALENGYRGVIIGTGLNLSMGFKRVA